ncbi:sensor domain-containing diguanylate cyclase [Glaciecola petra]|uniref:diguanylate cyclase n=1 Tax=Glaciecola petra TaxID=3075602 RepID=A0ABU2ZS71_9ALTE|nr:diguanylate cyclase [Aestuariibacter sp. P117]MDT0595488.1 diguanylate cyclase [Aestuariibacter sp. P117]
MQFNKKPTLQVVSIGIILLTLVFLSVLMGIPYYLSKMNEENGQILASQFFVDTQQSVDANKFYGPENSMLDWQKLENENFGLSNASFWIKLKIEAAQTQNEPLLLIDYSLLDQVNVWFIAAQADSGERDTVAAYSTGDSFPFYNRIVEHEQFLFNVPSSEVDLEVFIRVRSEGAIKIPITLWDKNEFIEYSGLYKLFAGIFFGYLIAMIITSLFVYSTTRNPLFIIYSGFVFSIILGVASLEGFAFHYLWPNWLWVQEYGVILAFSMTAILGISMSSRLLELRDCFPNIYRLFSALRLVYIFIILSCLFFSYALIAPLFMLLLCITIPLICCLSLVLALRGNRIAMYYCATWLVFFCSCILAALENFGIYSTFVDYSVIIMGGALLDSIILSFALATKFNQQLEQAIQTKDIAINKEIEALEAQEELLKLQEQNKIDLEYNIEERTLELEIALRELAEKNQELERLSAIDPLTSVMNRRYFDKRLLAESRRSRREITSLGILMLDIDHFKKINDNHGHLCGDYCLKLFAQMLKDTIKRPTDVICRYGGEEFVLILPNTSLEGLQVLAERIRLAIQEKTILFESKQLSMTVSIGGCSRVMGSEEEHAIIIGYVDKLLYQAKETGRNRCVIEEYQ